MTAPRNRAPRRKVVIVGAGAVGATFAYALAQAGLAEEIALVDMNRELAEGQVLDLGHGLPFFPPVNIKVGSESDYADAQVVVMTAGSKQRPGEPRLDLLRRNAGIVESVVDAMLRQNSSAILLMVSNPVDVLTHVALRRSGWPRGRVFGSGTVLDSARLRYFLSQHCQVDAHNVHAYVLGEHGDSEFAAWSLCHLAGMSMDHYCGLCRRCADWREYRAGIERRVRESAYHIIGYKGATWFAVGLALVRIVEAILRDQRSLLTVSVRLEGEYGLVDVCLSVPCLVAEAGVVRVVESPLVPDEMAALTRSAGILRAALESLQQPPTSAPGTA